MRRACKYELYPNKEQAELIFRTVGCARFVYNNLLDNYKQQLEDGVKPKLIEVSELKKSNDFLNEVDSLALANAKQNLGTALSNFYKSRYGER